MSNINLSQVWHSQVELQKLLNCDKLEVVVSWRLSKLVKVLSEIEEQRRGLVKKLGQESEEPPGFIQVPDDQADAFNQQFNALLNEPLDHGFKPIELTKLDGAGLTPLELVRLEYLLVPPDEDEQAAD